MIELYCMRDIGFAILHAIATVGYISYRWEVAHSHIDQTGLLSSSSLMLRFAVMAMFDYGYGGYIILLSMDAF